MHHCARGLHTFFRPLRPPAFLVTPTHLVEYDRMPWADVRCALQRANAWSYMIGCELPPLLRKKTVGMMGLKGVPGLRIGEPAEDSHRGGGKGGTHSQPPLVGSVCTLRFWLPLFCGSRQGRARRNCRLQDIFGHFRNRRACGARSHRNGATRKRTVGTVITSFSAVTRTLILTLIAIG